MKSNKVLNYLWGIGAVLTVAASIYIVSNFMVAGLYRTLAACFAFCGIVVCTYYVIFGYGKGDADKYKTFLVLFGLSELMMLGTVVEGSYHSAGVIARAAAYGGIIILCVGKDLGKKPTLGIAWFILAIETVAFVYFLVTSPGVLRGGELSNTLAIASTGVEAFMSDLTVVVAIGKYKDKAKRGSK